VHDFVRAGTAGERPFYAVYKRAVFDRPARIALQFSAAGALLSREDRDELGRVLTRTEFKWNSETRLPREATTSDGRGRLIETWSYDLAPRTTPFPEGTFSLGKATTEQIVEDAELRPIADYEKGTDAEARFNLGAALLRHTEDIGGALAAWGEAARLKPQAIAPHAAIYDAAMRARDLNLAEQALGRLSTLRGADDFGVISRRLTLEVRRRNWDAAASLYEAAAQVQPQNLEVLLSRANLARARGDFATARTLLLSILASDATQPQTQTTAAEALAALAVGDGTAPAQVGELLQSLPRATVWQRLARAHIALLTGAATTDADFEGINELASLAQGQERAGQTEGAIASWQKVITLAPVIAGAPFSLTTSSTRAGDRVALGLSAREHLMSLHAQRAEVTPSLERYRELILIAPDENARRRVQDALLAAWKKGLHGDDLRPVLERRAQALKASEDDLSVWLAWQETFGTSEGAGAAVRAAVAKFPRSAMWHSRLAEYLADQAAGTPSTEDTRRVGLFREALSEVDKAAKLDPAQPYYAMQNALIQIQMVRRHSGVVDATQVQEDKKKAGDAVDRLLQRWPDDPDVAIAVAAGRNALQLRGDEASVAAFQAGMKQGRPERETASGDRHTTIFFARQALASLLIKLGRGTEAAREYEVLILSSREASEQARVAIQYLGLLRNDPSAATVATIARLLTVMAREPWNLEAAQGGVTALARGLVSRGVSLEALDTSLALRVSALLRSSSDPASIVAAAHLHYALDRGARVLQTVPGAPPAADRLARDAAALATASDTALPVVANGENRVLAPRASALLSERMAARGAWNEALTWLERAAAAEPTSIDLRVGLARAYAAAGARDKAVATRDHMLRAIGHTAETLRRAAVISRQVEQNEAAARFAAQALHLAQATRSVSVGDTEEIALLAARTFFAAGQEGRSISIWTGLTSTQWSDLTRLTALADWHAHLRKAGRSTEADAVKARLDAFKPSEEDVAAALQYVDSLT
jgi:tetratricopeptide (TPR) repeat protein